MTESAHTTARHPHCGHCGYDLTGAPGNRCPECGALFIEAGIVLVRPRRGGRRLRGALIIAAAVLLPTAAGLMTTLYYRARAAAEAALARAQAAQAAALARFQAGLLQSGSASMPSSGPGSNP